jgi:hypothetical protein
LRDCPEAGIAETPMFAETIKVVKIRERNDCTETSLCGLSLFLVACQIPGIGLSDNDGRRGREVSQ